MLHSWMRRGVTWTMMAGAMHALNMVVSWGHSPTESVTSEKVVPAQKRGSVPTCLQAESWQSGPGIIQLSHGQAALPRAGTPQLCHSGLPTAPAVRTLLPAKNERTTKTWEPPLGSAGTLHRPVMPSKSASVLIRVSTRQAGEMTLMLPPWSTGPRQAP